MATTETQLSSYHVFLSFSLLDVQTLARTSPIISTMLWFERESIHLATMMKSRGENIELEIQKAIRESKLSIIILSKDYASSRWYIDELVMIMERRRLVPVFYDVDPVHVREQTGSYGYAFARHQNNFMEEMEKVEQWRAALREVAGSF